MKNVSTVGSMSFTHSWRVNGLNGADSIEQLVHSISITKDADKGHFTKRKKKIV